MLKKPLLIFGLILFTMSAFAAINVGDTVQDFTLKGYDGKDYQLSSFKNKDAIILIFVSTRCPVSNAYNKRMAKLYEDYSGKNVAILGINSNKNEKPQDIAAHAKKNGLQFPILKDDGNKIADIFGATVTPEVFVLDPALKVVYHGHIDDSQRPQQVKRQGLRKGLDEFLAGKPISDSSTKAFGCSIKRVK